MRYTPPLHVHVVFAREHPHGVAWARRLERWLTGDRDVYAVPQANIPVFTWSGPESAPPPDIVWSDAEHTAVVLLVDDWLVGSDAWQAWAQRQAENKRPQDKIICSTITANFANLDERYELERAVRLDQVHPEADREEELVLHVTHAIARWFSQRRAGNGQVRLFISHAKKPHNQVSGADLAVALQGFLSGRPTGKGFFDAVDIAGGDGIEDTLEAAMDDAVVIVLLTDRFSSRYWCGWEVARAKQKQRPLLVVDALSEGEPASLAHLGKTRTIRWDASTEASRKSPSMHRTIIVGALLELLRTEHDRTLIEAVGQHALPGERVRATGRPPEAATLPDREPDGARFVLVYPDPPVPRYELVVMQKQRPDVDLLSVTQALAGCHAGGRPLRSRRVAISISNGEDQAANGLGEDAQERLWTRMATHLLAAGAELAYGGDLRRGGYTDQLLDLARSASDAGAPLPPKVVHWHISWPLSAQLSAEERAKIPRSFVRHPEGAPAELDANAPLPPPMDQLSRPEDYLAWTLGLRDMRRAMAKDCVARVLVGGALRSLSPWPGLLEEFETFLGKPIYLIGAFGGMTRVLIQALEGKPSAVFTQAFQDQGGRGVRREHYEEKMGEPINLPGRLQALQQVGIGVLDNGLDDEENRRLFVTRDPTETLALVLKGLRSKLGAGGAAPLART